jgi:ATP:ADP antiporter, AAA family
VSIVNLFLISIFWSFMADLYRPLQSKRLFGVVAVGGTVGAMLGSTITTTLAGWLGPITLLLVSALLLEFAAQASRILERHEGRLARVALEDEERAAARDADATERTPPGAMATPRPTGEVAVPAQAQPSASGSSTGRGQEVIGGRILDGIRHVLRSPYLLGIAGFVCLFAVASTYLYFQVAALMEAAFPDDRAARTQIFAARDLAVNLLTLVTQLFLTGRILRVLGVGVALAFLPVVSLIGFGILGLVPVLMVAVVFEVLRRAGNFAIMRPTREVLYTVLARTDRYKAKNFNDTFVYRLGDQIGAWSYQPLYWLGFSLASLALIMVPISMVWLLLALWLGRAYRRRYALDEVQEEAPLPAPAPARSGGP